MASLGGSIANKATGVIISLVTVVVVLAVGAAVLPDVFENIGDINSVFENNASDLNNSLGAALSPLVPLILIAVFLFGIAGILMRSTDFGR